MTGLARQLRLVLPLWAAAGAAGAADYVQQEFLLPAASERLLVADTNGDDRHDLVTVVENRVRVYFQDDGGFDFDSGYAEVELPGDAVGWNLSSGYGDGEQASLIALIDGSEVLLWHFEDKAALAPVRVKDNLPGFLSKGVNRLFFSRDINGDGREDLVIPGAGTLHLYIAGADGSYQEGLGVLSENRLRTSLSPGRLERQAGQGIRIPMMDLRDVNGDGFDDLISRTEEKLDVFLADGSGASYFPPLPSYTLDIAAIEEGLGEFDFDNLDFSNLTGVLALTHEELLEDVDGDGIEDLLLREGGKVSLFAGTATGMDFSQPRQVLRSGGNVLSTFLYDEDEDGLKDLWLWRVEPISVGDIFVWLALSGSIAIEAFIYPNDGERFARRPTRKLTVDLRFPSVIRLATSFQELTRAARATQDQAVVPAASANIDADPAADDLLVLANRQLEIFLNRIEPELDEPTFLGALGYSRQRDDYEINIGDIINNVSVGGDPRLTAVSGEVADITIGIAGEVENGDVIPVELNGDGLDDIFVFTGHNSSHIQGMLLLSK